MIKEFIGTFFWVMLILGVFFLWVGLDLCCNQFPAKEWILYFLLGAGFICCGSYYHRGAWFFQPPMKSEDVRLVVGSSEKHKEKEGG